MKKVNPVVYNKLVLQAEEAKFQGLEKLASGILNGIGSYPEDPATCSLEDVKAEIYNSIWKIATSVIGYHNIESVDAGILNEEIEILAEKCYESICNSINVDEDAFSELEPLLPGEII
jgi:hypothetical protein